MNIRRVKSYSTTHSPIRKKHLIKQNQHRHCDFQTEAHNPKKKSGDMLFHFLLNRFRLEGVKNKHLLIAVSGGVDSVSLLALLLELKDALQLQLSVVHVHHHSRQKQQKIFQDKAIKMVQNLCQQNNICFYSNLSSFTADTKKQITKLNTVVHSSEAELRRYRYQIFKDIFKKSKADYLVLAHTANDLLETRLIRLIRGTGTQGLPAMVFKKGVLLRPFLSITRQQLTNYIKRRKWSWCEDPSNQLNQHSLRNWIRQSWLPLLEQKRPGSIKSFARSLELIAQQRRSSHLESAAAESRLRIDFLLELSYPDRQRVLAGYMRRQGLKNYSLSHIQELMKRLDSPQKTAIFFLLGKKWKITDSQLFFENKNCL